MAPELLFGAAYAHPVDQWAVGIVLFELLTGGSPFFRPEDYEYASSFKASFKIVAKRVKRYRRICSRYSSPTRLIRHTLQELEPYFTREPGSLEYHVADLIVKLLSNRPNARPDGTRLFQHPFFKSASSPTKIASTRRSGNSSTSDDKTLTKKTSTEHFDDFGSVTTREFFYGKEDLTDFA